MPINNPKKDLHNINAHTKIREIPLMFTQVITRKRETDERTDTQTSNVKPLYPATKTTFNSKFHFYGKFWINFITVFTLNILTTYSLLQQVPFY